MKVLYSSNELNDKIAELLEDPLPTDRRVVLVAFVGGHAEKFLPNPKGLEIVCSLQPGATDDQTVRRLRDRGARLFKSNRLHMKVYWSSRRGCVICSANASANALGRLGQKEAGVWLPPGHVDIERLWTYADPKPINPSDLRRLRCLSGEIAWHGAMGPKESAVGFLEWRKGGGQPTWKLGWWDEGAEFASEAISSTKLKYGVYPYDLMNGKQGQLQARDWLLTFRVPAVRSLSWFHVDFVIPVNPADRKAFFPEYPFQAVQAKPPKDIPREPFRLTPEFNRAFRIAVKSIGLEKIASNDDLRPPRPLLELIAKNMQNFA